MIELTVVIPTFNRARVLAETLRRLASQRTSLEYEVIIVDDGSTDDTAQTTRLIASQSSIPIQVLDQQNAGPAAARNRGIAAARGRVLLFLGDDTWPRPDLVERHISFHRSNPEAETALLGQVVWAKETTPSPFMEWLSSAGIQFAYQFIENAGDVPPNFFYTANVSVKAGFLRSHGVFDEAFLDAALEDTELGLRLADAGMRLVYESDVIAEHFHPADLPDTLDRVAKVGRSARLLVARFPNWHWFPSWHAPPERRPSTLAKEALLAALHAVGIRPRRVRHSTWWLLCQQSFQSGYWDDDGRVRGHWIERRLRHYAARDPATRTSALDAEEWAPEPPVRRSVPSPAERSARSS